MMMSIRNDFNSLVKEIMAQYPDPPTYEQFLELYDCAYKEGYTKGHDDGYKVGLAVGKYSKWLENNEDTEEYNNEKNHNCFSCKYMSEYDELHLPCCLCRAGSHWESADEEQN